MVFDGARRLYTSTASLCSRLREARTVDCQSEAATTAQPRQLLVDVSIIIQNDARTGIQRAVRGIWSELSKSNTPDLVVRPVFATRKCRFAYAPEDFLSNGAPSAAVPVKISAGDVFLGLDLSPVILPRHETQLKVWQRLGVEIVLVLYDMLPLTNAEWFNRRTSRNFRHWLAYVARRADHLICISDHVRREFERWHATQRTADRAIRLASVRLGSDIMGALPSDETGHDDDAMLDWTQEMPTILLIGTVEPRKAHAPTLRAFEQLWKTGKNRDTRLLLIGKPGWKTKRLQQQILGHAEFGKKLQWMRWASDALLLKLHDRCAGVIMPSYAEGFGLPVAEALFNGKSVLARKMAVMEAFNHPHLTMFEDDSPAALANSIDQWLDLLSVQSTITTPISTTTWSDTARDVLALLGSANIQPNIKFRLC